MYKSTMQVSAFTAQQAKPQNEVAKIENNKPSIFSFEGNAKIRVVMVNGEPHFVGKDVAEALGYSNTRDALIKFVDQEDKADVAIHDGRQNRNQVAINESGIYSLIFSSKLESAKRFKKWVTGEVLPTIRKTGSYEVAPQFNLPQTYVEALEALVVCEKDKIVLAGQLGEAEREVDRLQGVCNVMAAQFAPGLTIPKFCKQLNGVNTMQVVNHFISTGALMKTKLGVEPTSYYRDKYFKLSMVQVGKDEHMKLRSEVTLTLYGAKWIYRAYLGGVLPMKKGWDGSLVHLEFDIHN